MKAALPSGFKVTVETTRLLESDIVIDDPSAPPLPARVTVQQLHLAAFPVVMVDTLDDRERRRHRILRQMTRVAWEKLKAEVDLAFSTYEETFER